MAEFAEQVRRGDLKPNAPHYGENPLVYDVIAGPREYGPDDMVWIYYTTEEQRRGVLRKEAYYPPVGRSSWSALGGIVNSLGPDNF